MAVTALLVSATLRAAAGVGHLEAGPLEVGALVPVSMDAVHFLPTVVWQRC